jgi:DNA-binding NtrC family response regulator
MSSSSLPQVLICDDDPTFHLAVKQCLKGKYACRSAHHSDEAAAILAAHPVDVVLLDVQMRTPDEGLRAIPRLREIDPDVEIVMASGLSDLETIHEAVRKGAHDYVPKDFEPEVLEHALGLAMGRRALRKTNERLSFEAATAQRRHVLVGDSEAIGGLRKVIEKYRASDANVVITGETGTGKEVVARQLRSSLAPFVAVDSATIQSSTAESQLFGHEKGAFTGAERTTKGVFEEADGGIVYFDEIANMPLEIQAKLLRVLQEKEVTRLGSSKTIPLRFRVICATNQDLGELVRQGKFKDDLLQRLNVLPIELVPLRERKEDIPGLVAHFANQSGRTLTFTEEALSTLAAYEWPGNVRELGNLVAYVLTMADGPEIDVTDLPPRIRGARPAPGPGAAGDFYERVAAFERRLLSDEYARLSGNVRRLAMELNMDRSHLYTKLREHGIKS